MSFTLDGRTEYWLYLQHGVDIFSEEALFILSHFGLHRTCPRLHSELYVH